MTKRSAIVLSVQMMLLSCASTLLAVDMTFQRIDSYNQSAHADAVFDFYDFCTSEQDADGQNGENFVQDLDPNEADIDGAPSFSITNCFAEMLFKCWCENVCDPTNITAVPEVEAKVILNILSMDGCKCSFGESANGSATARGRFKAQQAGTLSGEATVDCEEILAFDIAFSVVAPNLEVTGVGPVWDNGYGFTVNGFEIDDSTASEIYYSDEFWPDPVVYTGYGNMTVSQNYEFELKAYVGLSTGFSESHIHTMEAKAIAYGFQ